MPKVRLLCLNPSIAERFFTKKYLSAREDVHFERGMECDGSHTSMDARSDGNICPQPSIR